MDEYLHRLFEHMFWADTQVLAALEGADRSSEPVRLFAHILAAERVWLLRLQGEDSSVQPVWPDLSPEQIRALAADNASDYARLLDSLHDADLAADVVYANSRGVPYRNAMCDILTHVALHGSYHRGQIAAAIRRGGGKPVNTDFITFARDTADLADRT
jgi:uncharacterized damage-inducible protein DinB